MTFRVLRTNQYNQDLGLIHSTNGNHLESPNEGSSIDHQVTIYLHAQNITMFPTNETWYFASQILVTKTSDLSTRQMLKTTNTSRYNASRLRHPTDANTSSSKLNLLRLPFFLNVKDPLEDFDYSGFRCNLIQHPASLYSQSLKDKISHTGKVLSKLVLQYLPKVVLSTGLFFEAFVHFQEQPALIPIVRIEIRECLMSSHTSNVCSHIDNKQNWKRIAHGLYQQLYELVLNTCNLVDLNLDLLVFCREKKVKRCVLVRPGWSRMAQMRCSFAISDVNAGQRRCSG
ncbi:hypothetical protein F511_40210 [Dorcoceras hygrometricum]|uniref:Uncharacterized protein n=1 Tax=Dorcoceras hygrometricum TaxID=472368 RepID=A0A2Z7AYI1_9LAMI|nr:hypothetical protein F511_40210 [Dorcoceras hygrometricum]